jgi:hypothetical protein
MQRLPLKLRERSGCRRRAQIVAVVTVLCRPLQELDTKPLFWPNVSAPDPHVYYESPVCLVPERSVFFQVYLNYEGHMFRQYLMGFPQRKMLCEA